jgi:hypothetical protein
LIKILSITVDWPGRKGSMSRKHRREIPFLGSPGLISAKGGGKKKEALRIEGSTPPQFRRSQRLMIANRMTYLPGF